MRILSNIITSGVPIDAIRQIINSILASCMNNFTIGIFNENNDKIIINSIINIFKEIGVQYMPEQNLFIINNKKIKVVYDTFENITIKDLKNYDYAIIIDNRDRSKTNDIFISYLDELEVNYEKNTNL